MRVPEAKVLGTFTGGLLGFGVLLAIGVPLPATALLVVPAIGAVGFKRWAARGYASRRLEDD